MLAKIDRLDEQYEFFRSVVDRQLETRIPKEGKIWGWLSKTSTKPSTLVVTLPESLQPPITGEDDAIYAKLLENENNADDAAYSKAKNWLGGITALLGLVTTAAVLAAPAAKDLGDSQRDGVILVASSSFVLLALAVFFAYRAAYGTPGGIDPVSEGGLEPGLRNRVAAAKRDIAEKSGSRLRFAVILTVLGVGATFAATALTWFPPPAVAEPGNPAVCVVVDGEVVLKVAGKSLPVVTLDTGQKATQLRAC